MRLKTTGILGSLSRKRALRRWDRLAEEAHTASLDRLRELRGDVRAISQRLSTINHIANQRLTPPMIGSNAMKLPPGTDWSYRPELWTGPISPSGYAPISAKNPFGREVTLYHDCKSGSVSVRQQRNTKPEVLAPYGLKLDIYRFDGSFLSLVLQAPPETIKSLRRKHVLRLALRIECEQPIEISARINLKHGPNTEQVDRRIDQSRAETATEFDLSYIPFRDGSAEQVWFDLFFDSPSMNEVILRDLTLSRHPRAEI